MNDRLNYLKYDPTFFLQGYTSNQTTVLPAFQTFKKKIQQNSLQNENASQIPCELSM